MTNLNLAENVSKELSPLKVIHNYVMNMESIEEPGEMKDLTDALWAVIENIERAIDPKTPHI